VGVRVGVVAVAVVLAVAGCSGGDAPSSALPSGSAPPQSSSPPSNPPSTAAATPPPTAPPLPATATQDTPAGAQSFARYYIAAQDYANRSGDTRLLQSLGRCAGCTATAEGIERFYKGGGSVEGGELRVTHVEVTRHVIGHAALVSLAYSQAAGVLINGDGTRQRSPARAENRVAMTLGRHNSSWILTNIQGLG
jgi:hypothetical protein